MRSSDHTASKLRAAIYVRVRWCVLFERRLAQRLADAGAAGGAALVDGSVVGAPPHRLDRKVGRNDEVAKSDDGARPRIDCHFVVASHVNRVLGAGIDAVAAEQDRK